MAGKWYGSLGLFGLLRIHDIFEHAKLRSWSRDGVEFFGSANFIQFNEGWPKNMSGNLQLVGKNGAVRFCSNNAQLEREGG